MNAPLQIEATRVPRAAALRTARTSRAGTSALAGMPGRMIVSARASSSSPWRTWMRKAPASTSRAVPHTRTW